MTEDFQDQRNCFHLLVLILDDHNLATGELHFEAGKPQNHAGKSNYFYALPRLNGRDAGLSFGMS